MFFLLPNDIALYFLIFTILFGLAIGSFLNVCIYRIPRKESLAFPGSHCPNCNTPIKWYDNIPVLSYILLKGKCRNCKTKISYRYPLIEILNAFIWVAVGSKIEDIGLVFLGYAFSSVLLLVSFIDIEQRIIPDSLNVIILILALIKVIYLIVTGKSIVNILIDAGIGALSGSLLFTILYFVLLKVLKKQGIGGGDIKLTFAVGAFLGWKETLFGIALSAYIGLIILLALALTKKRSLKEAFPYGPFLALGFLIAFLWANEIFDWYMFNFI